MLAVFVNGYIREESMYIYIIYTQLRITAQVYTPRQYAKF